MNIRHYLMVSESSIAAGHRQTTHADVRTRGMACGQRSAGVRSKLAVRLERKMQVLHSSIELACNISKATLVSIKLDKLDRASMKKAALTGRSQLSCIPEDVNLHN